MSHTSDQNQKGSIARLILTVLLGAVASFIFTIFAELLTKGSTRPLTALHVYPEFPAVTVSVGALVGLLERNKTAIAAMLSFVPWSIFLVVNVNAAHSSASRWLITVLVVGTYASIGVGAATLTARTLRRISQAKASA
jgi:hypothetical protein